jgi:23S rRNA pseudouridine1911/1915/1917 synthase
VSARADDPAESDPAGPLPAREATPDEPPAATAGESGESGEISGRSLEWRAPRGGERLDKALAEAFPELSRAQLQRLIAEGQVQLDGRPAAKSSQRLSAGTRVVVHIPPAVPAALEPEDIPLAIVYEDADLLVVDKPAGMVVHPAPSGHRHGTLVQAVLAHVPGLAGIGGERRPGIVHRLDKGTSGLIVVAKHDRALRALQEQFKARTVAKRYLALVYGHVQPERGRIDVPVARDPRRRQRMAALAGGRPAVTRYRTLERFAVPEPYSLLACEPRTGRTHQIRVHLAALGYPIVGDTLYGRRTTPFGLGRPFLHAERLGFHLPGTGEWREFAAPLPPALDGVLAALRAR